MTKSDEMKVHISDVFTRASPLYDQIGPKFFSYFGKKLVEFADIPKGSRVLDVACGRGAVLFPASSSVSSSGEVIGIDISDGMVEHTRKEVSYKGISNTKVLKMDAENLEFQGSSFDTVLCGLSLFFFPNIDKALSEFFRVLKPGKRLVTSTFQKKDQDVDDEITKQWIELHESFKNYLKPIPDFELNSIDSEDEIKQSLSKVGFVNIEVVPIKKTFYYNNEEEWWETSWSVYHRDFLERLEKDALSNYKEQALKLILSEKTEQGIPRHWHLLFSKAQKPEL